MGELIELTNLHTRPNIRQVEIGVFLLDKPPTQELIETGDFYTASQFGIAGELAGKSADYGHGVMRDIATKMVVKNGAVPNRVTPRDTRLINEISALINNRRQENSGSRDLLLLGHQLVHDVWIKSLGVELPESSKLPTIGKVGQQVVSQLFSLEK